MESETGFETLSEQSQHKGKLSAASFTSAHSSMEQSVAQLSCTDWEAQSSSFSSSHTSTRQQKTTAKADASACESETESSYVSDFEVDVTSISATKDLRTDSWHPGTSTVMKSCGVQASLCHDVSSSMKGQRRCSPAQSLSAQDYSYSLQVQLVPTTMYYPSTCSTYLKISYL